METRDRTTSDQDISCPVTMELASFQDVFTFGNGLQTKLIMMAGLLATIVAGALGPLMAWYFAQSFEDLSADPTSDNYLDRMSELAYSFLVLG